MGFTLTPKRIEALKFIQRKPGVYVGFVAENVLAKNRLDGSKRPMWSQAATRSGAGYCQALAKQGLVSIDTYVDCGYGRVTITAKGEQAILDAETLDGVLSRCVDAAALKGASPSEVSADSSK